MNRTRLPALPQDCPREIAKRFSSADVYDSSCSDAARVYYIDAEDGFFLKRAPRHALEEEAAMTALFYGAGLGPEVVDYRTEDADWMLTKRLRGEDGTHLTDRPEMLCDLLGPAFRNLHDCGTTLFDSLPNRTEKTLCDAERGLASGLFHEYLHPERYGIFSPEDARAVLENGKGSFKASCLIHGDACLPNVLIDGGRVVGWIDCGAAGFGNRHSDLFWTIWSLAFNLKSDRYADRFLDAYGRDAVNLDELTVAAAAEAVVAD